MASMVKHVWNAVLIVRTIRLVTLKQALVRNVQTVDLEKYVSLSVTENVKPVTVQMQR